MQTFRTLHEFLSAHGDAVIERWQRRVQERLGPDHLDRAELVNEMPKFVVELIASLRPDTASALPDGSDTAPAHGRQRYLKGFDVDQVIREYGILGEVILEAVAEMNGTITAREARTMLTSLHTGAAEAVVEYVRRRDEESRHQNARHLSFVAHELRSPLGAAWTALEIVRRTLEQAPPRAVELLHRSLGGLRELIDHVLVAGRLEAGGAPK